MVNKLFELPDNDFHHHDQVSIAFTCGVGRVPDLQSQECTSCGKQRQATGWSHELSVGRDFSCNLCSASFSQSSLLLETLLSIIDEDEKLARHYCRHRLRAGPSKVSSETQYMFKVTNRSRNLAPAPHTLVARQAEDVDPSELYPAHYISMPVDHFHNDSRYAPHSSNTFKNRYCEYSTPRDLSQVALSFHCACFPVQVLYADNETDFDATYYKPGGPVIVLQSGETDASGRLPYLQKGIVYQLASALNGIGVVLEHRYYGDSFPTANLSTKSLRFLSTDQAVADQAYFASHVVFPGMEHMNLTAPSTPFLAYGGSYAGGMVSFLRKLYPDIYFGSISSSGVTEAIYDYWQYNEPIRQYGPPACIANQVKLVNIVDNILENGNEQTVAQLKKAFSMETLTHNNDFVYQLSVGIGGWQSRNWDPAVNSPSFDYYCGNISSNKLMWPKYASMEANATTLIKAGGWGNESAELLNPMLNFMAWTNDTVIGSCDATLNECYNYNNASAPMYTDKNTTNYGGLSWPYQYCTEWGYIQDGASVPKNQLPLVSRLLTVKYLTNVCRFAFNITSPPKVNRVNKYGGFNISYPRLATVGGEADVWRPATTLATLSKPDVLNQTSTASEPVILIQGAVHHWGESHTLVFLIRSVHANSKADENGLFPNETTPDLPPAPVASAQKAIVSAAQGWMAEWHSSRP